MNFMRRVLGYSITAETKQHNFFIFYDTDSNGKSTLINCISHILKPYAKNLSANNIVKNNNVGAGKALPDIERTRGARLVFCSEWAEDQALKKALVKQFMGESVLAAWKLYGDIIEFTPKFKFSSTQIISPE